VSDPNLIIDDAYHRIFVERGDPCQFNDHFTPQACRCGMWRESILKRWRLYPFDSETRDAVVARYMADANISDEFSWVFQQEASHSTSGGGAVMPALTADSHAKFLRIFAIDYHAFGFAPPAWAPEGWDAHEVWRIHPALKRVRGTRKKLNSGSGRDDDNVQMPAWWYREQRKIDCCSSEEESYSEEDLAPD